MIKLMNSEATLGRLRQNSPRVCVWNSPAGGSMHPLSVAPFAAVPYVNSGPVPKARGHRLPMQHARKWTARKMKSSNGFIEPAGSDCSRHPSVWPRLGDNVCVCACVCVLCNYEIFDSDQPKPIRSDPVVSRPFVPGFLAGHESTETTRSRR